MIQQHTVNQLKHLFLQQSCIDAWTEYDRQLHSRSAIVWDYIVLTASNEEQAAVYESEIAYRLRCNYLPDRTKYLVLPDPEGKRVGSGGATFNVLKAIAEREQKDESNFFRNLRILVIHSGGDSKRIPQYSACGKLFSPIPRSLPNGQASTLFDEFMVATSLIPGRMQEGMLVMSGDVLLLFNALQIDTQFYGAAAISIKEDVETGKNHGVFLGDEGDKVRRFLHKQSVEELQNWGAVNSRNQVDLDTGAILMDRHMLKALYSLISTDNKVDMEKFGQFVNEQARISFYGDFLYPLASDATLETYQKEAPEGSFTKELFDCRTKLWEALHNFQLKLISLSPAEFIHFGTTWELRELVTETVEEYSFLGWQQVVSANVETTQKDFALHNVFLEKNVTVNAGAYVENSYLGEGVIIGKQAICSGINMPKGATVPENTVYHGLKLQNDKFVVRTYGIQDNPKDTLEGGGAFLGGTLTKFLEAANLKVEDIWAEEDHSLWKAKLYPVCDTIEECLEFADILVRIARQEVSTALDVKLEQWKEKERLSLYESFNRADSQAIIPWREHLANKVRVECFVTSLMSETPVKEALNIFCDGIQELEKSLLLERLEQAEFSEKIRLYNGLACACEENLGVMNPHEAEGFLQKCFQTIQQEIAQSGNANGREDGEALQIQKDEVRIQLPVRVNWGGGWTDTPPYCNEHGGVVLNAAISLRGKLPICVTVRRLSEPVVELESQDVGAHGIYTRMEEINNCGNPYDKFALHKAALIACGIIRQADDRKLQDVLTDLGGGIYLSTQVIGVPKGSGLGTSSILSVACAKGLYEFLGKKAEEEILFDVVLCMEQLMSTGGGWQDQVGGLVPGIKMITSKPGSSQRLKVECVTLATETLQELQERFTLIYTGQRRLARNLLRDVVGGYIGNRKESLTALKEMKRVAALMQFELEQGNVDAFAELLNRHWELSVQLDAGSTNTCIEQIFLSIEDMIDGKFIAGAGGGGFLQVILKKGVTKEMLRDRLYSIFQDSGVDVWECELILS
ncbi:MAG: bifunctional fucokinase/L-fucose-1-P-guanylyltransferase [Lachnospiraceae bacterium]|nr:bifunctional fucokinase/L-fucose-1-P-guanylyltransferase [Lachnospiraceae bacterium]